jgi:hypothetical protein
MKMLKKVFCCFAFRDEHKGDILYRNIICEKKKIYRQDGSAEWVAFQFETQFDWLMTTIVDLSFLHLCRRNMCSTNIICVTSQKSECLSFVFHFCTHTIPCHLKPLEKGQRDIGIVACFNLKCMCVLLKKTVIKQTVQAHDTARRPPRNKVPLAETHKY